MMPEDMLGWGALGIYIIIDIIKHIITLSFKLLEKQINKEDK